MELKVLPVGEPTFEKIIKNNWLYVDKTALVHKLVKENCYIFLARPRRFGKSLLVSTLKAYFEGKKELFKDLAMEKLEKEWTEHPVFHFDLSDLKDVSPEFIRAKLSMALQKYENEWKIIPKTEENSERLIDLVQHAVKETGKQAVLLIDEYDSPLLNAMHLEREEYEAVRLVIQQFYSPIKKLAPYWKFVMLTGITKFSQVGIFSQLNNLTDISMLAEFDAICGITKEEILTTFKPYIEEMASAHRMTYDEMLAKLKFWYDGYHFGDGIHDIYNPYSLIKALHSNKLGYYWFTSGTGSYLIKLLRDISPDLLRIAKGWTMNSTRFDVPALDSTSVIPMLYQSGYLTIKDADRLENVYTLGIPNHEVKVGMMENLFTAILGAQNDNYTQNCINDAYMSLRSDDVDGFMTNIQGFFANISYENYKNLGLKNMLNHEQFFHTLFYVALSFMNINIRTEVKTPTGSVDAIAHTRNRIYIFEFKLNGNADEALKQIHEKKYYDTVKHLGKEVWLVGVEFGKDSKRIEEWKVEKM